MTKFTIALCVVLALAGCDRVDYGECYHTHVEQQSDPLYMTTCSGSGANMMCSQMLYGYNTYNVNVCDNWQYPKGDGPKSKQ